MSNDRNDRPPYADLLTASRTLLSSLPVLPAQPSDLGLSDNAHHALSRLCGHLVRQALQQRRHAPRRRRRHEPLASGATQRRQQLFDPSCPPRGDRRRYTAMQRRLRRLVLRCPRLADSKSGQRQRTGKVHGVEGEDPVQDVA